MQFIQNKKDGSAKFKFSWKERFILFFKGSLFFDALTLKHFGNTLVKMVVDWQANFDDKTKNTMTKKNDSIEGK